MRLYGIGIFGSRQPLSFTRRPKLRRGVDKHMLAIGTFLDRHSSTHSSNDLAANKTKGNRSVDS